MIISSFRHLKKSKHAHTCIYTHTTPQTKQKSIKAIAWQNGLTNSSQICLHVNNHLKTHILALVISPFFSKDSKFIKWKFSLCFHCHCWCGNGIAQWRVRGCAYSLPSREVGLIFLEGMGRERKGSSYFQGAIFPISLYISEFYLMKFMLRQ